MLFVIDVGNSNITLGVYGGEQLKFTARMATDKLKTGDQYAFELLNILKIHNVDKTSLSGCIVSNVVPTLTSSFRKALSIITEARTIFVGPGIKTGLNIKIDNASQLGADLAACAVAALAAYTPPCVILDLGTATTISVLDKDGAFLGGAICAGLGISLEALNNKTSQLPSVSIESPSKVIGTNTIDCMKSGLVIGAAAMIDGIVERVEGELGQSVTVIATGGLSPIVIKHCNKKIIYNDALILQGLKLIYEKNTP